MNKLLTKAAKLLLGLSLAAGVGVAIGSKAAEKVDAVDATMAAGSNSSTATVNSKTAIKCGTSSKAGAMTITLSQAGATSLSVYVAAWSGDSTTVKITTSGLTISPSSNFQPTGDSGISGSGSSFTLNGSESTYLKTFTISNASANATVTFTANAASKNRFVVWGPTYTAGSSFTPVHAGTVGDPYDITDAYGAIDANTGITNVHVAGIVSQVDSYSSTYNSITYWISDDGTTTSDQLEVYSGKGLNNANFSSVDDVLVGAEVVVYGTLKKYNSVYEFDKNNYLTTYNPPASALHTVSFNAGTGGSGTMSSIPDVTGSYTLPNSTFTAPTGKVFAGWKANNSGDLLKAGSSYEVTEDVTFYAQWVNAYTVTYTAGDNGSGSYAHISQPEGSYTLLAFANLSGISASSGYRFKDYTVGGSTKQPGETITLSSNTSVAVNFEVKPEDTTYVFATNYATYASSWTTTYGEKTIDGKNDVGGAYSATIKLSRVNKQSSGVGSNKPYICPNTASDEESLVFTLTETGKKIKDVTVSFEQRGTNAPTFKLFKGNDVTKGSALDTATIGTKDELSTTNLNDVSFSISGNAGKSGNVGAGLTSIYISVENQASFGTLDHIAVTSLPNVIYHVGETFDSTGLTVTAYDGANEATANFKDVTASVETDLDNPTAFVDGDVPGFDCEVQYTGDGGSDTTSFHVYVYALAEYELVTSEPDDWSGEYLIVGTKDVTLYGMNGSLSPLDVEGNHKVVTEDANNIIETGQELEFVIAQYSTGYSIKTKANKYVGWSSGSNNGLTESDSALINTLTYSDGAVVIAGSGGRHLNFNTDGNGRFRYYQSGSVQLYRLKESSNAIAYAETFLAAFTCDASGVNGPTFTIKEGSTYWNWSLLATEYDTLNAVEKEEFRLGVASESGDEIAQALARYDYVVGKYGTSTYSDFMSRNPAQFGNAKLALASIGESSNTIQIIVIISLISVTAIGGFFFIRKRKVN